jgi:hypothetical protein
MEALIPACGTQRALEIKMPPGAYRTDPYCGMHWDVSIRLFDVAPSGQTTFNAPVLPNGDFAFSRFTQLQHLTLSMGGGGGTSRPLQGRHHVDTDGRGVIPDILANLPLRSLTVRSHMTLEFSNLELVSDTLETFNLLNNKRVYVTGYRCPKLKNLNLGGLQCYESAEAVWKALQEGVHSLDLMTIPVEDEDRWYNHGFEDGVFCHRNRR